MQNVPQVVRERLKATTPATPHPDADVLTAFAERSLPERERSLVIEHLARCGNCRDVVALALPASEDLQKVLVPSRRWLTWPVLRWGLVTVGIVAIAGVGFLQIRPRQAPKVTARIELDFGPHQSQPAVPKASPAEGKDESRASTPASGNTSADRVQPSGENKLIGPTAAARVFVPKVSVPAVSGVAGEAAGGPVHNQFPHGPLPPAQWQQQTRTPAAPLPMGGQQAHRPMTPPVASETVEVQGAAPVSVGTEAANQDLQLQAKAAQPPTAGDALGGPIAKSKPAVTAVGANAAPQAAAVTLDSGSPPVSSSSERSLTQFAKLSSTSTPRWTVSPSGTLQRSFDQGQTWQDVDVNVNAGFAQNYGYAREEALPTARGKEAPADKKALKQAAPAIVLRAVSANGTEVWVGGSSGLLYHSLDAGGHWTRVLPLSGATILTGDIVALEFYDAQHGKVTTSTAEVWITADDGQTWQKQ